MCKIESQSFFFFFFFYRFILLLAMVSKRLVKKTTAHVVVRLLGFFLLCFHFLLLSWGSSGGGGRTACWCGSGCWSRPTSPYIADEAPNVDIGQGLCKQARPERFNIDTSCFNEGIDLILCDVTSSSWRMRAE